LQHVLDSGIPNIAVLWDAHDHFLCLKTYTPDVICLGYDQIWFSEGLQEFYTRQWLELPNIVRLKACNADKRKSTLIAKSS
jgi:glycerol-3-phosphate cytidylyltransferase-like family protein